MSNRRFYTTTGSLLGIYLFIAFFNIIKQKIIAYYTGLEGMGILGLFNSYLYLLYAVGSLSVFAGLTKYISEFKSKNDFDTIRSIWSTALYSVLLFSIIITLLVLAFSNLANRFFFAESILIRYFIIATISLPFYVIGNLYLAGLKGFQSFHRLAFIQWLTALLTLPATFYLVRHYHIDGIIYSLLLGMIILTGTAFIAAYSSGTQWLYDFRFRFDRVIFHRLLRFAGIVLITGLFHYGIQFFIRIQIVHQLGLGHNGAIQAAFYFSMFNLIVQETIYTYLYPRLSELNKPDELNHEINLALRLAGLLTVPVIAFILLFLTPLIYLLLTPDFLIIRNFILWIFLADYIRLIFWILGSIFLAQGKLRQSFWLSSFHAITYGLLIYLFMLNHYLTGFVNGYFLAHLLVFLAHYLAIYRLTGFRFKRDNLILLSTGFALLLISGRLNQFGPAGIILNLALIFIWIYLTVRTKEWDYLKKKIAEYLKT